MDESIERAHGGRGSGAGVGGCGGRLHGADDEGDDREGNLGHSMISLSGGNVLSNSMVIGAIDPLLWQQETERVAPKLAQLSRMSGSVGVSDWSTHVNIIKQFAEDTIGHQSSKDDAVVVGSSSRRGNKNSKNKGDSASTSKSSSAELSRHLSLLKKDVEDALQGIKRSEALLNNGSAVQLSSLQYTTIRKVSPPLSLFFPIICI